MRGVTGATGDKGKLRVLRLAQRADGASKSRDLESMSSSPPLFNGLVHLECGWVS